MGRILTESLARRDDVQWYTAMLGFLSSVNTLIDKVKKEGITNWAVGELMQGTKTRRWAVAWSFGPMRPAETCRQVSNKSIPLPPPTLATIWSSPTSEDIPALTNDIENAVSNLDLLSWSWDKESLTGTGRTPGNVWNRSWRRKKKALEAAGQEVTRDERDVFGFKISVELSPGKTSVECRWLEGHDYVTFESFQGFLKTTIRQLLSFSRGHAAKHQK